MDLAKVRAGGHVPTRGTRGLPPSSEDETGPSCRLGTAGQSFGVRSDAVAGGQSAWAGCALGARARGRSRS